MIRSGNNTRGPRKIQHRARTSRLRHSIDVYRLGGWIGCREENFHSSGMIRLGRDNAQGGVTAGAAWLIAYNDFDILIESGEESQKAVG